MNFERINKELEKKIQNKDVKDEKGINYFLMILINQLSPDDIDWDSFDLKDIYKAEEIIYQMDMDSSYNGELIIDTNSPYYLLRDIGLKINQLTKIPYEILPSTPFI